MSTNPMRTPLDLSVAEAQEVVAAIQEYRVDAFVVTGPAGKRVVKLQSAELPYRSLVAEMKEGALTVDDEGRILYCNHAFARMAGVHQERLFGLELSACVCESQRSLLSALLAKARRGPAQARLRIATAVRSEVPVMVRVEALAEDTGAAFGAVVSDLSRELEHEELAASEELARAILEQAADAVLVCNLEGVILRANEAARAACAQELVRQEFALLFPLRDSETGCRLTIQLLAERPLPSRWDVVLERPRGEELPMILRAGALRSSRGELLGYVLTLNDISHRVRAERERQELLERERRAREEAERANRAKDDFVATLSHELRTPLSAILGWSAVLRAGADPATSSHGLQVIERNARLQTQLVNDLLDISRIATGEMRLERRLLDLRTVVRESVETITGSAGGKDLRLECELDELACTVEGDAARLHQVICNVLANAVKFTPPSKRIEVALRNRGSEVELAVRDEGEGIPASLLPYLFERHRQGRTQSTRRNAGLGLGLSIAKHLVELHGGRIRAESPGEGLGATFTITLPAARAVGLPLPQTGSSARPSAGGQLLGVRVLYVDDEPDARELMEHLLEGSGASVTLASSMEEALELLGRIEPSILISDIGMPGFDGLELIARVRQLASSAAGRIPAIALTAFGRAESREQALRTGFDCFLTKPVEREELLASIGMLVRRVR